MRTGPGDDECVFCEIIAGREPASVVFENDDVVAFLDLFPIARGHTLVVPKQHARHLADLPTSLAGPLFAAGQEVAARLRATSGIDCPGVNLFLSDGAVAGQEVMHVHLHVVPRHPGDRVPMRIHPAADRQCPRAELDVVASSLRTTDGGA